MLDQRPTDEPPGNEADDPTTASSEPAVARGRRRQRKRRIARRHTVTRKEAIIYGIGGLVLLVFIWQIADWLGLLNPLVWSSPSRVVTSLKDTISDGTLLPALQSTGELFGIGFGVSLIIGIPLGLVLGWYRRVNAVLDPLVSIAYALPRIALIPLVVVWFGPSLSARVTVVVLLAIFPIMINVASGIATVSDDHLRLARSYRAMLETCGSAGMGVPSR